MGDRSILVKLVRPALLFFLTLSISPLSAQDSAPYVSRLAALAGPRSVLLTWQDAEGYEGGRYEVWRSNKEIVRDTLNQSQLLATVAAGVEAFEDTTVTSDSFYLVLLRDDDGNRAGYYIPYRNKTTTAVKPEGDNQGATARVKVGGVTYASPQVLIPFQAFPPDRKLSVYRRPGPFTTAEDLKDASLLGVTTASQGPWRDTPPAGLEFYYAVVDAQAFADAKDDVFTADNATTVPAGFPLLPPTGSAASDSLDPALRPELGTGSRSLPLPRLRIGSEPETGSPLTPPAFEPVAPAPLGARAERTLQTWAKASAGSGSDLPPPVVLPEERSGAQAGAARSLVQIQKAYLEPKDWKGAEEALNRVLKLTLEPRTEARARFYRAETFAYRADYRRAFVEFLAARDEYPAETGPFLEALLSLLESTPD